MLGVTGRRSHDPSKFASLVVGKLPGSCEEVRLGKRNATIILPWEVLGEKLRGVYGFVVRDHVARARQRDNDLVRALPRGECPTIGSWAVPVFNLDSSIIEEDTTNRAWGRSRPMPRPAVRRTKVFCATLQPGEGEGPPAARCAAWRRGLFPRAGNLGLSLFGSSLTQEASPSILRRLFLTAAPVPAILPWPNQSSAGRRLGRHSRSVLTERKGRPFVGCDSQAHLRYGILSESG